MISILQYPQVLYNRIKLHKKIYIVNGTNVMLWVLIVTLFYNSKIVHGMSPEDLNCSTMIPIPKNSHAKVNESDNI